MSRAQHVTTPNLPSIREITQSEWDKMAETPIFFGHQSVGRNIVAGMRRVLEDQSDVRLSLLNLGDAAGVATHSSPAFFEASIGRNQQPHTKADAFSEVIKNGFGTRPSAVAMLKYCYVDMLPTTDPDALFRDYVNRMGEIKRQFPELRIVHFTMPLQTAPTGWKVTLRTLLRRPTQTAMNLKRERYNQLLRDRYGTAGEPLFDLAFLESTRADGSRAFSLSRGREVPMLAPEWTYDGGHLNDEAQIRVAERLLAFLAKLAPLNI